MSMEDFTADNMKDCPIQALKDYYVQAQSKDGHAAGFFICADSLEDAFRIGSNKTKTVFEDFILNVQEVR